MQKKNLNKKFWLMIWDERRLKNNKKKDRVKPCKPVKFMIRDMKSWKLYRKKR
jgi:hypothetical protein